jgi:hypothetical protein
MNKSIKWISAALVLSGLLFVSYKTGQNSVPPSEGDLHAKEELIALTQKDFEEYQNLKTLEDRYQKADEILGKIMTVFLADLGMRLGYKPVGLAELDAACAIPGLAATPGIIAAAAASSAAPALSSEPPIAASPVATSVVPGSEWIKNEAALLALQDERAALEELRKMEIKDLFSTLKGSGAVDNSDVLQIEGVYSGTISFFDRKLHKSDWRIRWEVQGATQEPLDASMLITLTDKGTGKTFSRSRSKSGPLKEFMKAPGSKGLIVNVYGDDGYIQIYPLNGDTRNWVGNYYGKTGLGAYALMGQVRLVK